MQRCWDEPRRVQTRESVFYFKIWLQSWKLPPIDDNLAVNTIIFFCVVFYHDSSSLSHSHIFNWALTPLSLFLSLSLAPLSLSAYDRIPQHTLYFFTSLCLTLGKSVWPYIMIKRSPFFSLKKVANSFYFKSDIFLNGPKRCPLFGQLL